MDTSTAGNYTVTYTITNSAGKTASATRQIRVIAPVERTNQKKYSFSGQMKQGNTDTQKEEIIITEASELEITLSNISSGGKTQVTLRLVDIDTGEEVVDESFTNNEKFDVEDIIPPGRYRLLVTMDKANGNEKYKVDLAFKTMVIEFTEAEVPLGVTEYLTETVEKTNYWMTRRFPHLSPLKIPARFKQGF